MTASIQQTSDQEAPAWQHGRIVVLARDLWHDQQWMNRQHICSRLAARGWRLVYSNGALGLRGRDSEHWAQAPWLDRVEADGELRVVQPGRLSAGIEQIPRLARRAERRHVQMLIEAAGGVPDWLMLFSPRYAEYIDYFPGAKLAYHVYDHFPGFPRWNHGMEINHRLIVERADLLTTSSAPIARDLPPPGPERAIVMTNAANVAAFEAGDKVPCPADLEAIPRPRIVYAGALNAKLDFALILRCATERPRHHWIFVGPEVEGVQHIAEHRALRQLANVHFLGLRSRNEIPAYLAYADVATIPYDLQGAWSFHGSPNKLPEALAAGKPVVSTPLPAAESFAAVTALASTPDEWLAALDAAIAGRGVGNPEARREVARRHDWEGWVDRYEALLLAPPQGKTQTAQIDHGLVSGRADAPNVEVGRASSWRA
jgi:glycosyltransferase involved in cell wall biosynthesis